MLWGFAYGQSIGSFRYDSVRFEKVGGNSEFILLNSTRNVTGGVLTNLGNGRTGFVLPGSGPGNGIGAVYSGYGIFKINDSTIRADTNFTSGLLTAWRLQKTRDSLLALILGKQPSGNYITALTGDITATGPGSVAATLSNTGVTAGSYSVPNITVDVKGRVTNISTGPTIPAQFNPIAGTNMSLSGTYPNITFNASGGSGGSPNTSVGAGYRVAINATNNIKSLKEKYGVTLDSATTGEVGISSDTTTVQAKNLLFPNSVEKTGVTVRLVNDQPTPTDYSIYGKDPSGKGWKQGAFLDTANRHDSSMIIWDTANRKYIHVPYASGGGSGSYIAETRLKWNPGGQINAPPVGDSVMTRDSLIGNCVKGFYRGSGQWQTEGDTLQGYSWDASTGTLSVHPPFAANERCELIFGNCIDSVSMPGAPATWVDLSIGTNTGTLINTSGVWTTTGSFGWANYGLDALRLTGDGSIRAQYVATDGHEFVLGFNATNSSQDYPNYEYGVYVATSGALSKVVNGTSSTISYSLSVGDYVRINRTGSTFKIQSSPDGTTWTDRWTFVATSSATHYVNLDIYQTGKCYYPQGFGLVP